MEDGRESWIPELIEKAKKTDIITEGLNTPYSPNHNCLTTREHVEKQLDMIGLITEKRYEELQLMVENNKVKRKILKTKKEDLETFFEPLMEGLTLPDLKILIATTAMHDIGKADRTWVKENLNTDSIRFICHEQASYDLLKKNDSLTEMFHLNEKEHGLMLQLVKRHSLPGQYFFGEGSLAGYQKLLDYTKTEGNENTLKLARIHGLLDVMSALNRNFTRPIINAHKKLSETITAAYKSNKTLEEIYHAEAIKATDDIGKKYEIPVLSTVSLYRLMKLTGLSKDDETAIRRGLFGLEYQFAREFEEISSNSTTWYGEYVSDAFGTGLKKTFGENPSEKELEEVVKATVKIVAGASAFHKKYGQKSFFLNTLEPAIMVEEGQHEVILEQTHQMYSLQQTAHDLFYHRKGLYAEGDRKAVEVKFK